MELAKEKLYQFTNKIAEALQHRNVVKQVYEIQEVVKEIWKDGEQSVYCKDCGYAKCICDD